MSGDHFKFINLVKLLKHSTFIRSPDLLMRILKGFFNTLILKRDTLRSIELAITYQCQASCHKCYAANLKDNSKSNLTVAQVESIVNKALRLGLIHINITGGEPTLRSDLMEIIEVCQPSKIMLSMVTNALTMSREKMKLLKEAGLNTIQISLDSHDSATHDKLRGVEGCYDKVLQAASWAREFNINLCFSTVLSTESSSNRDEIKKLVDLAKQEKAFLLICDSAAVGGWEKQQNKMMSCQERNDALSELMKYPNARHHNMYNFRMKTGCPAGVEKVYISAYGDVTPCDLIHDSFGNVLEEELYSIWKRMCAHPLYSQKMFDCVRYHEGCEYGRIC